MHLECVALLAAVAVANVALQADGLTIAGQRHAASGHRTRFELDLQSLTLHPSHGDGISSTVPAFKLLLASINGSTSTTEVACVNCDAGLFEEWAAEHLTPGCSTRGAVKEAEASIEAAKHPNAPGYRRWAENNKPLLLLEKTSQLAPTAGCSELRIETVENADELEATRLLLPELWAERRLILGFGGIDPLHQRMDFVQALESLARRAPLLVPRGCKQEANVPQCDAHLLGTESTAAGSELRSVLRESFGAQFLKKHTFDSSWTPEEQRHHVKAILAALKSKYKFYRHHCLAGQPEIATCNQEAASEMLGHMQCDQQDAGAEGACVYSEVRLCQDCDGGKRSRFFEYARYHGPLALFRTIHTRNRVLGQCEEFSRAAYALLAALGYEARYVLDFTDHVWIEVRIPRGSNGTWLHTDPSEGVLDTPLMYEEGWGKKLTMIFAFTPSHIEHVTARYTKDYAATLGRRGLSEDDLAYALAEANARLQYELPLHPFGHAVLREGTLPNLQEVALWAHFETSSSGP